MSSYVRRASPASSARILRSESSRRKRSGTEGKIPKRHHRDHVVMPDVTVLFDETHREAWSIRPDAAAAMQPTHPQDASYVKAADLLRARRMDVVAGGLDRLDSAHVVVIAHPAEDRWERNTRIGSPVFSAE